MVLEAKNAQVTDESAKSARPKKRTNGEPSEQSRDRSNSIQQNVPYLSRFEGKQRWQKELISRPLGIREVV